MFSRTKQWGRHDSASCSTPARDGADSTADVRRQSLLTDDENVTLGGRLMPSRHGRGVPDDRDPQAAIDMDATRIATFIAGLRWRLRRQELLEHPTVLTALRGFQDQIEGQLAHSDQNQGRHRSAPPSEQIKDVSGLDQKPDPLTAETPAEFIQVLWKYKFWSGDPSWRTMARKANQMVVHSTMYAAMNGDALPKFDVMKAIIIGCGGGEEDLKAFASAWRRIGSLIATS
jgi:hypothetical protein